MGRYEGREAIREFFRGISGHFVFALHYGLNPRIAVSSSSKLAERMTTHECFEFDFVIEYAPDEAAVRLD